MNKYLEKIAGLNLKVIKGLTQKTLGKSIDKTEQYTGRFGEFLHSGNTNRKNLMTDATSKPRDLTLPKKGT